MGCISSSEQVANSANNNNALEYENSSINWKENKSSRIVIIGAGPAGIHMASLLKKQGFTDVTILERNDKFTQSDDQTWNERGKSVTIKDKEYNCVHEMGTCYTHPKYDEIRKLLKEYDPDNIEIPYASSEKEIVVPSREYAGSIVNKFKDKKLRLESLTWSEWVESEVEKLTIPQILQWLPDTLSNVPLLVAAKKYIKLHKEIFGDYDDENRLNGHYQSDSIQFPPKPNLDLINKTFLQWILDNELQALIPNFIYNQSIQGIFVEIFVSNINPKTNISTTLLTLLIQDMVAWMKYPHYMDYGGIQQV